jgi:hypothetical protein
MAVKPWITLAALVGASLAAAQDRSIARDPADPAASVPAPLYQSAFSHYRAAPPESGQTPDQRWRARDDAPKPHGEQSGQAKPDDKPAALPAPAKAAGHDPAHHGEGK